MRLRKAPCPHAAARRLDLIDNELTLWEYRLNDGTYTMVVDLWVCQNGSWEKAQFYPGAAASEGRFGVHVTGTKVEYIDLAEDGTCRYGTDCPMDVTSDSNAWSYSSLTGESVIEPGVEIPLLARLGWDESSDPVPTDWQNFQDSGCDTGVAITVLFTETAES